MVERVLWLVCGRFGERIEDAVCGRMRVAISIDVLSVGGWGEGEKGNLPWVSEVRDEKVR